MRGILAFGMIAKADLIYDSWARAKVGTVVKYKQLTTTAGLNSISDITDTLKEVSPAAATVELKMDMIFGGKTTELPTRTIIVQVGVPTPPVNPAPAGGPPKAADAKEDVVVDGKTYSCTVSNGTLDQNGTKTVYKTWMCSEVPGLMVKNESTTTGTITASSSQTLTGIENK